MIPRIILSGDQEEARLRAREGIRQLGILKGLMSFGQLKQDVRRVRYTDGSEILCRSIFGIEDVTIYVPPEKKKEVAVEICILAGMGGGSRRLLRSTDEGNTWGTTSGMPGSPYTKHVLSFADIGNGILLAGIDPQSTGGYVERIYRSVDCGVNWTNISLPDPLSGYTSGIASLLYLENGICLAGSYGVRLYRSVDGGETWTYSSHVLGIDYTRDLAYLESGICIGAFGHTHSRVFRSTDYGVTWSAVFPHVVHRITRCVLYLEGGICLAGTDGYYGSGPTFFSRLWRSTDYGLTWTRSTDYDVEDSSRAPLSMVYLGNGICLIGTLYTGKILRSIDYGLTWTDLGQQAGEIEIDSLLHLSGGICFAGTGTQGKILKSSDYGLTWADTGYISSTTNVWALAKSETRNRKRY